MADFLHFSCQTPRGWIREKISLNISALLSRFGGVAKATAAATASSTSASLASASLAPAPLEAKMRPLQATAAADLALTVTRLVRRDAKTRDRKTGRVKQAIVRIDRQLKMILRPLYVTVKRRPRSP